MVWQICIRSNSGGSGICGMYGYAWVVLYYFDSFYDFLVVFSNCYFSTLFEFGLKRFVFSDLRCVLNLWCLEFSADTWNSTISDSFILSTWTGELLSSWFWFCCSCSSFLRLFRLAVLLRRSFRIGTILLTRELWIELGLVTSYYDCYGCICDGYFIWTLYDYGRESSFIYYCLDVSYSGDAD